MKNVSPNEQIQREYILQNIQKTEGVQKSFIEAMFIMSSKEVFESYYNQSAKVNLKGLART